MKTHALPTILLAMTTLAVMPACTTTTPGQAKPAAATNDGAAPEVVGGFFPTEITKDVQKAAAFAVRQQSKKAPAPFTLVKISRAETQVVAGANYRLILAVRSNGKLSTAEAIVFQALDGHYESTSWRSLSPQSYQKKP